MACLSIFCPALTFLSLVRLKISMNAPATATLLLLAASTTLWCQTARPRFEVASIKRSLPATEEKSYGQMLRDPGRVSYLGVTLQNLLAVAYHIKDLQIAGPSWLDSDRFDIVAKLPHEANDEETRAMLQALLEDRFKLTFHKETRPHRAYGLMVAPDGLKVTAIGGEVRDVHTAVTGSRRHLSGKVTMIYLAGLLSNLIDRPVVDLTALKGVYPVDMDWTEALDQTAIDPADTLPLLTTILRDKLGLRLDNRTVPVEMYVIDHVDRIPVEN
jgi:uncharacterized protein (TIGR03435 family)